MVSLLAEEGSSRAGRAVDPESRDLDTQRHAISPGGGGLELADARSCAEAEAAEAGLESADRELGSRAHVQRTDSHRLISADVSGRLLCFPRAGRTRRVLGPILRSKLLHASVGSRRSGQTQMKNFRPPAP